MTLTRLSKCPEALLCYYGNDANKNWKRLIGLMLFTAFVAGNFLVSQVMLNTYNGQARSEQIRLFEYKVATDDRNHIGDGGLKMGVMSSLPNGFGDRNIIHYVGTADSNSNSLSNARYSNKVQSEAEEKSNEKVAYYAKDIGAQSHVGRNGGRSSTERQELRYRIRNQRINQVCQRRGVASYPAVFVTERNSTKPISSLDPSNNATGMQFLVSPICETWE